MARRKTQFRGPQDSEEIIGAFQGALNYLKPYLKWLIAGVVTLVVVLGVLSGYRFLEQSREARAQAALDKTRPQLSQPEQAEAALTALDALIKEYPSTQAAQMARLFKAHILFQTKKYADAAKTYEEARSTLGSGDPYAWSPFVTESLSYCYEAQGDYVKAAQTLKPLVDRTSGGYQAIILAHLALLEDKAGNPKEAALIWERLLSQTHTPALKSYWKEKLAAAQAAPGKTPAKN
jgi:tetratricopeptide (TPR) repeat protein